MDKRTTIQEQLQIGAELLADNDRQLASIKRLKAKDEFLGVTLEYWDKLLIEDIAKRETILKKITALEQQLESLNTEASV